jgi:hypothetical protein
MIPAFNFSSIFESGRFENSATVARCRRVGARNVRRDRWRRFDARIRAEINYARNHYDNPWAADIL